MSIISIQNADVIFQQRKERKLLRDHVKSAVGCVPQGAFYALHDINLTIGQGESVGIVGANGAGKSTLLGLLAGLAKPDRGSIQRSGTVSALLELGSGFHPELTGRENLILNAALLGLSRERVHQCSDQIVTFSELGHFVDEPLRTYSSGMVMRLAFSVAAHAHSDLLLIDEILAVGDAAFQHKCIDHIRELRKSGTTLVFVSHVSSGLDDICDRLVWLHHGKVVRDGAYQSISEEYRAFMADPVRRFGDEFPEGPTQVPKERRARG